MTDFALKSNDTVPIQVQLTRDSGPVDLSDAEVQFLMRDSGDDAVAVDSVASIDTAQDGIVSYHWDASDTTEPGLYLLEWEVTFNPDTQDEYVETFPSDEYMELRIVEDIG